MRLSVLTMVTKPDEREDTWREALANYCALADEVIVVNGGLELTYENPKVKFVNREWPEVWEWQQLPHQLNFGLSHCTGDWVLKLDIDQFVHEKEFEKIKMACLMSANGIDALTLNKLNYVCNYKYYSKNTQIILFRRQEHVGFGVINNSPNGDLCEPMAITGMGSDGVPTGRRLYFQHSNCSYWNFGYAFKTQEIAKAHYLRMCRAYENYYKDGRLGITEDEQWNQFISDSKEKYKRANLLSSYYDLPASIRDVVQRLKTEQKGFNLWGLTNKNT